MANFKCKEGVYNLDYEEFDSPQIQWKFIDNDANFLRKIALKLFAVVPHSASCERNFSGLGWFYGNRRYNLNTTTIESMSKIRHFYLTNAHSELQYSSKNHTEEDLAKMLKESNLFNDDELEEEEEEEDNDNLENESIEDKIPQHEVYVLIMTKDIDLTNPIFDNESEDESDTNDKENENDDDEDDDEEFDINEIIADIVF